MENGKYLLLEKGYCPEWNVFIIVDILELTLTLKLFTNLYIMYKSYVSKHTWLGVGARKIQLIK
jgi:hypothetical protein